ncbi:MAG: sugar phosphate nucleotidyltransferase [Candidatus Parcubacteria bacterium]|nr:sugar phosphate nucleotidyltransferase [Candidatus Parcubacteria bacterium]
MKAIILAGGKGTRLPESAKIIPKALVKIGSKTILQHQIDWLKLHGISDIRLSLGFRANQISSCFSGIYQCIVELKPLGTGGAIKLASEGIKEPFLAVNGDILTDIDITRFINAFQTSSFPNMMAVYEVPDVSEFGSVVIKGDSILEFSEKSGTGKGYMNAGVYILSPNVFEKANAGESFSIERDIFPSLAKEGKLGAFIHNSFWTEVGTEERLKKAQNNIKNII